MTRCLEIIWRFFFSRNSSNTMSDQSLLTPEENRGSSNVHAINDSSPKEDSTEKRDHTPPEQSRSEDESTRDSPHSRETKTGSTKKFGFNLGRSNSTYPDGDYWEKLPLEAKRGEYTCGCSNYVTLSSIKTWQEESDCATDPSSLTSKISLWRGDITRLEIDAIVNAANSSLLGGGGVDGAIHRAASRSLLDECRQLNGCVTGDAKLTRGHRLPAKYILHTVGPMNRSSNALISCYESCLKLVEKDEKIRSVAFSCVSTGIYGYPNEKAANIALTTVKKWLEVHADKVDRIIFCVFLNKDYEIYRQLIPQYFPAERREDKDGGTEPSHSHRATDDEVSMPEALTEQNVGGINTSSTQQEVGVEKQGEQEMIEDNAPQEKAADNNTVEMSDQTNLEPSDSQTEKLSEELPSLRHSLSEPAYHTAEEGEVTNKSEVGGVREDHPPHKNDDPELMVTNEHAELERAGNGSLSLDPKRP